MKINRLVLDNFRAYNRLDIDFETGITVIVGENGEGKTSILDAISQLFGYFLQRLPGVKGLGTSSSDLRIGEDGKLAPALRIWGELDVTVEWGALPHQNQQHNVIGVSRSLARDQSQTTKAAFLQKWPPPGALGMTPLTHLANAIIDAENQDLPYLIPLVVYYKTNRAVFETPLRRRNFQTEFARFDSLNGALGSNADFKRVFEWFHAKETEEALEQKRKRSFDQEDPELTVVRRAIEQFFPMFTAPRIGLRPLRFLVDQKREDNAIVTFDLNQLSDGYRTTLAMVTDLACRMVAANPPGGIGNIGDPLQSEAIVLIDEVDLHLHPRWQQTILADLRRVFPNTQFIVTTHSPQVLTTVEANCIRILRRQGDVTAVEIPDFSLGAKSVQLLEDIQHVDARPPMEITRKLAQYKQLVEQDKWDSEQAKTLRRALNHWGGNKEAELMRIDIDIKMRAFRRRQG